VFSKKELERQVENAVDLDQLSSSLEELLGGPYGMLPNGELYSIKVRVDRVSGVRIIIRPNDHPPPHFHVRGQDFDASFDIDSGNLRKGQVDPAYFHKIKWWHKRAKGKLLEVWNETRPTR
jgi:hypothetical protein